MNVSRQTDVDMIEELRLRTWARHNYVSAARRNDSWHPIILEEMHRRDHELNQHDHRTTSSLASRLEGSTGRLRRHRSLAGRVLAISNALKI